VEWIYYDPLPPSLFLVSILGSCAIMHFAAKQTATATATDDDDDDDDDAVHSQLHSFRQPRC